MSLDFYLKDADGEYLFSANMTHNLNKMAEAAGLYKVLWRPEELGIIKAHECVSPLITGLVKLIISPEDYKQYNSPNGWGMYEHFVPFVLEVLMACQKYPEATVEVSR